MSNLWVPGDGDPQASLDSKVHRALALGKKASAAEDDPMKEEMRKNRRVASRGGDVSFATGRPRDPMFYWKQNNLPWEIDKPEVIERLRQMCRQIYLTNPVISAAIDIYSKYPVTGAELRCKDPSITEFYEDLFFDTLEYEDFLVDVGREYWTVGEAWPFGSFNELLGVWEDDELLNPDDIDVIITPFQREPRYEMKLPQSLRDIIEKRDPKWEYEALMTSYPELQNFIHGDARMPVSNVLLQFIRFKGDTFNPRGVPIIMRILRFVLQEEMMNAAQEAVASRLYTPLILAKLGATAQELGTESPWIPTQGDLEEFEGRLDAALAADFRVLTHHFAVDMRSVFGRETMPRLDADFDRITKRQLQGFGLSETMLSGAGQGQTYAADALNRDLVSQLLTTYQRRLKRLFRQRALVVAEAQGHYDYEIRGGKRFPIMEEVLEVDEDGNQTIVEQPKLLVPDLHLRTMSLRSETEERQFIEALRNSGVPISSQSRMVNVPIDLDEEVEIIKQEQVDQAVAAQETRKATYEALRNAGLPIPQDLIDDFQPKAMTPGADNLTGASTEPSPQAPLPLVGSEDPTDNSALIAPQEEKGEHGADEAVGKPEHLDSDEKRTNRLPRNKARPPESDEQRAFMPRSTAALNGEGELDERAGGLQIGPKHVGMRRHSTLRRDTPLDGHDYSYDLPAERP